MIAKFNSQATAESFSYRCFKATAIVLGDDGKFWVVTLAVMVRLQAAGYEVL